MWQAKAVKKCRRSARLRSFAPIGPVIRQQVVEVMNGLPQAITSMGMLRCPRAFRIHSAMQLDAWQFSHPSQTCRKETD